MSVRALLLLLLVGCGGMARVCAQESAAGVAGTKDAATVQPDGRVEGTLFCSDTRKPARGAKVSIRGKHRYDAIVGLDGHYDLGRVEADVYRFEVNLPGYRVSGATPDVRQDGLRDKTEDVSDFRTVSVRAGMAVHYDVMMERGVTLSGRVLYSDGAPAVGALIVVEVVGPNRSVAPKFGSSRTDEDGRFRVTGLRAASYRVGVAPKLATDVAYGVVSSPIVIFSPATPQRSEAKVFEGKLGDEIRDIAITIPLAGLHTIRGRVSGLQGEPANMGHVTMKSMGADALVVETAVGADGEFEFAGVPDGTYQVSAKGVYFGRLETVLDKGSRDALHDVMKPKRAFADVALTVLVNDNDVVNLALRGAEIAVPARALEEDDDD